MLDCSALISDESNESNESMLILTDFSILHHDDAIGKAAGQFVIVRYQQDGQPIVIDHLAQQGQQLARAGRV